MTANLRGSQVKVLYLFRHAKSSWDDPYLDDFARPLSKRGQKSAPLMGQVMKERGVRPEVILCSPARRTEQTAALALKSARIKADPVFDSRVYLASAATLLNILAELDDDLNSVLLIGHNPGMSDLLELLTGVTDQFPTAALAAISLNTERWPELKQRCGRLEWILRPKELI